MFTFVFLFMCHISTLLFPPYSHRGVMWHGELTFALLEEQVNCILIIYGMHLQRQITNQMQKLGKIVHIYFDSIRTNIVDN